MDTDESPGYSQRTLSEQAQLLDFPDMGYRTGVGGKDFNVSRIASECRTLLQMAPTLHSLRVNTLQVMHCALTVL